MLKCSILTTRITVNPVLGAITSEKPTHITSRKMVSLLAAPSFRHDTLPFDSAEDAQTGGSHAIESLLAAVPNLKVYTRASPRYESLRGGYNKLITAKPLAMCRPTSVAQVRAIIKTATGLGVPVGVRCGGHDVIGRGCIADSITIDMRELDAQKLADDKKTVTVGGGIISRNLVGFLASHGLCTSNGFAGEVGWTSWASWGGYGPLGDYVGLGVDNILGATIVTASGNLIAADGELLWALKGAGGDLGVIVETKVKTHPMTTIQAGFIVYPWEEASKMLLGHQTLLDAGVPDKLCVQAGFSKGDWGLGMALTYIWPEADTIESEGREWLNKLKGLGTVVVDTIQETTFRDFQSSVSSQISEPVNVTTRHISFPKFTQKTMARLVQVCEAMPDEASCTVSVNILHGQATRPNSASSFGTRKPHVMLHINAVTEDASNEHIGINWADSLVSAVESTGETIGATYVSFLESGRDAKECYGDSWERLKDIKKTIDPLNVFRHAHGRIPVE
ncbi:6-hydroxy-d-nicotine oxidase [Colletotrichum incanum]|uniref:6-hydroxy-d-nicotine oxidase n=1 Tax=Colletotrichum incanum TaxID=1573173 RepID=A0A166UCV4_COLIC|nr:6-hydroxy-d-nicotine oxidase [Colletotrichum incanum]